MVYLKQFLPKVMAYLRKNPGASFVIGFQILLLVCVGFLIVDNSVWAERLSVVAYFTLVIGVVLQLISSLRSRKREEGGNE